MNRSRHYRGTNTKNIKRQAGFTLIEAMIGIALSMIVIGSMVSLMGNSLGSATRIIQMTQLSDELRNTMSMLTRDLRRANYSAKAVFCFANSDCGVDGTANQAAIVMDGTSCVIFNLDRDLDGNAASDDAGAFRLATTGGGVGYIEMWVGDHSTPACDDDFGLQGDDWMTLNNPDLVDITEFSVTQSQFVNSMTEESGNVLNQYTRGYAIAIEGELILDSTISRRIEDTVNVRNDFLERTTP